MSTSNHQGGHPRLDGITEDDIAQFLAHTPGFFERHAQLLASVQLTSPHGQRAVSLQERQMEMLRDKIKGLERRLIEMVRHGQEHMTLVDKLHRATGVLLAVPDAAALPVLLLRQMQHEFLIPQAALRLWGVAPAHEAQPWAAPVSADLPTFAASLAVPYCGANVGFEAAQWLPEPEAIASMAMLPLRRGSLGEPAFGLLVLASPDATRYAADLGTDFLQRMGEVAGAALARLLP